MVALDIDLALIGLGGVVLIGCFVLGLSRVLRFWDPTTPHRAELGLSSFGHSGPARSPSAGAHARDPEPATALLKEGLREGARRA